MTKNIQFMTVAALLLSGCGLDADDSFELPEEGDAPIAELPEQGFDAPEAEAVPASLDINLFVDEVCYGAPIVTQLVDVNAYDCDLDGDMPEGWVGYHMFEAGSPTVESLSSNIPDRLYAYCRYEYVGEKDVKGAYGPMLQALVSYDGTDVDSMSADCLAVSGMAGLHNDATLSSVLERAFAFNIDSDRDVLNEFEYREVEMAVLDTVDGQAWLGGTNPVNEHGLQMRGIAESISCLEGVSNCQENIHDVLVTPRDTRYAADWERGESLGIITDFSTGLYYAIQSWRERMGKGKGEHRRLVVNASVGADIEAALAMDPEHAPMSSVQEVLAMGACLGVIVVSSAGNVRDEACPAGEDNLLAPARYETVLMPDEDTCAMWGYAPDWDTDLYPVHPPHGVDRPLIYAVGGVTGSDTPIMNKRPNSEPRLVATSSNALTQYVPAPHSPTALTGTSVGSMVVAATARLGWGTDPSLRPDQVMEVIYDSGYNLGRPAEDGRWVGSDVRRVSVCAALDELTGAFDCKAPMPEADEYLGTFFSTAEAIVAGAHTDAYPGEATQVAECDTGIIDGVITPQPEVPVCAFCTAGIMPADDSLEDDTVYIDVDPDYEGDIYGIRLILDTGAVILFSDTVVTAIRENPMGIEVHQLPFAAPAGTTAAALQFKIGPVGKKTQTNTVPVYFESPT